MIRPFRTLSPVASPRGRWVAALALAMALVFPWTPGSSLAGQEGEPPAVPPASADVIPEEAREVGPGGAFARSLVLPGWGHLVTGSPSRGAFYFGSAAFNGYMIAKTQLRIVNAEDVEAMRRREVTRELLAAGEDPAAIPDLLEEDERIVAAVELREAREQQLEDWLAWGIFMVFLGAADAFVSAHLIGFPEALTIQALPAGNTGRMEVGVSLPWSGPGG